jgi:hypothetical protein
MIMAELLEKINQNWKLVLSPKANPQRWDNDMVTEFQGYSIFNLTDDFNYSKCHTYQILAHAGKLLQPASLEEGKELLVRLGGQEYSILLKLSVVLPFYQAIYLCREMVGKNIIEKRMEPKTTEHRELLERVHGFAKARRFEVISEEYLKILVPNATLELAKPGTVTVYNCLFEDQSNHPPLP